MLTMSVTLTTIEWQYLCHIIPTLYETTSYTEFFSQLCNALKALVNFDLAFFCELDENCSPTERYLCYAGKQSTYSSFATDYYLKAFDLLPHWPMVNASKSKASTVYKQSDIHPVEEWESWPGFIECWKPINIYYGIAYSLMHSRKMFCNIIFTRSKEQGEFTQKDELILNALLDAVEMLAYSFLRKETEETSRVSSGKKAPKSDDYDLTKRESEIVRLICQNKTTAEICDVLFISRTTFNKHLSNIYKKTSLENRTQIYAEFSSDSHF